VPTDFLTLSQIAEILDVKTASARVYHEVASRNRRENQVRPTDMPEPMNRIGNTPIWDPKAIDEWMTRRTPRRRSETRQADTEAAA
jgi:predicted DNA-binding transcriptional regulator AlpA